MNSGETLQALDSITDSGLFEQLATAVLREADSRYNSLIHTGVNSRGQTIKGPVDGVGFLPGAKPPHMIFVHHTIGARTGLRKKWLYDPSTVPLRKKIQISIPLVISLKQLKSTMTRELEPQIL